jgi:hypothetical protein
LLSSLLFALVLTGASACGGCGSGGSASDCEPGERGCECAVADRCDGELSCVSGTCTMCSDTLGNCAPTEPICYTPCSGNVTSEDGSVRICDDEGLLPGCLPGSVCAEGSCLPNTLVGGPEEETVGTCSAETDCADYQTCIDGRCVSTCVDEDDCSDGATCYRRVCRAKCTEEDAVCDRPGFVCYSGRCVPTVPSESVVVDGDRGGYEIEPTGLSFRPKLSEQTFEVTNTTSMTRVFRVSKATELTPEGSGTVLLEAAKGDDPLPWIELSAGGSPSRASSLNVTIGPGETSEITVGGAANGSEPSWQGTLEISSEGLQRQTVRLGFADSLDGAWVGRMYTFGTFEDGAVGSDRPLERWTMDRSSLDALEDVPNAFLGAWGRFRNNALSMDEFRAILRGTLDESWKQKRVRELCEEAGYGADAVCVPFGGAGSTSVLLYSSAGSVRRVPSGVVETDFGMNVRQATPDESDALGCDEESPCFVGRIDSERTLQYAGNPAIQLAFEGSPQECTPDTAFGCRVNLDAFAATITMGGRYIPGDDDPGCDLRTDLDSREYPWLVSGFSPAGVQEQQAGQARVRRECVDNLVPGADGAANADLSRANPVPDGRPRVRRLEMVDGFVANQQSAFVLVRETIEPFVPAGDPLVSYALIALERQDIEVDPTDYIGSSVADDRPPSDGALGLSCDPALIAEVTGLSGNRGVDELTHDEITDLARAVIRGDTSATNSTTTTAQQDGETPHYLCVWEEEVTGGTSGEFDDLGVIQHQVFGAGAQGSTSCPPRARVVYFTLDDGDFGSAFDPASLPCNQSVPERCLYDPQSTNETLSKWVAAGRGVRVRASDRSLFTGGTDDMFDLVVRCDDGSASCDFDTLDLTRNKTFLAGGLPEVFFDPIEREIRDAFRYKTEFVSRTGASVGFAPEICRGSGELTPFCYDPDGIQGILDRVDCALAIYEHHLENDVFDVSNTEDERTLETLRGYLDKNFSRLQSANDLGDPVVEDGFERLLAELLIMQGDDAYTDAFASRFDLAAQNAVAFEGDRFETGGLQLSGGAGFEMYSLYRATQYYEMVLDRFYSLTPILTRNVTEAPDDERFVTQKTVTSWLTRVARASTQNAAAWSEIARRYQSLNRPDLARRVLARAYARSFAESTILGDFLLSVMSVVGPSEIDQLIVTLDETRVRYRVAMTDMRQAFDNITDDVNYFGLPPDLVPFPALGEDDVNGFEVLLERARESLERAASAEARALEQDRQFDIDAEAFRAELVSLRLEYEAQLGEICGTFVGSDGRVYPAIGRYAHRGSDELAALDDPCGAVGVGDLHIAAADLETRYLELQRVRQQMVNLRTDMSDAAELARVQCKLAEGERDAFLQSQRAIDDLQGTIDSVNLAISAVDKAFGIFTQILDFNSTIAGHASEGFSGLGKAVVAMVTMGVWSVGAAVHFAATVPLEDQVRRKEAEIRDRERRYEAWTIGRECAYLAAELGPNIRSIQRELDLAELDSLDATWNIQAQLATIKALNNDRIRIQAAWDETNQLLINAAAAASDPNVRIFKNDAIIGADRTFRRALRDLYRLTRMFEYYTSSSYANFEQLFLARLVNAGDYNLQRYLRELEEAFFGFEQQHGNPDTRVAQISLRDDILKIPRYSSDGHGRVLSAEERTTAFRDQITGEEMLDENGYLSFEFNTSFDELSPLTANHKILFMEVELLGDDVGDNIGRIYVRQLGTGTIRDLEGDPIYYTFPPQAAVMNPVFNGDRSFGQDSDGAIAGPTRSIFRSYRFRDRPYVQTRWELVLNQRSEAVNDDINLSGIDDIVLTVFYTDFTP